MSRPPFHILGILPFILGTVIAYIFFDLFKLPVFLIALFAIILIMLVTYYNGEYYDIVEDRLSFKYGKNKFSGGSQVIAQSILPKKYAKFASYISLGIAIILGLILQIYYKTGIYTILLGFIGIFFGFFYSNPPLRFASRGIGEILIGFSYSWLPVLVGVYLQTQKFFLLATLVSIPIGFTIFNVILINEFPDYFADKEAGKKNLVVRFGREIAVIIYIIATILSMATFIITVFFGIPLLSLYIGAIFFLISILIIFNLIKKAYNDPKKLEFLCGLTLLINIGITLSYILGLLFGFGI